MVLSRRDVLIEVISNGKIERIFADALVPAGKNLAEVSGECLVVEDTDVSSSSFAQKILVAGTEDEDAASRVALHAKKELASAIMVTREPRAYVASSTPSFLISEGELDKFVTGAEVATWSITTSYEGVDATLSVCNEKDRELSRCEWRSKLFSSVSMTPRICEELGFLSIQRVTFFRHGGSGDIVSFGSEDVSGKICLAELASGGDLVKVLKLATEKGAKVLFYYDGRHSIDLRGMALTLPVVHLEHQHYEDMKISGVLSDVGTGWGISFAFKENSRTPHKPDPPPSGGQQQHLGGRRLDDPAPRRSNPTTPVIKQATRPTRPKSTQPKSPGFLENAWKKTTSFLGYYRPESKSEFDAIAKHGLAWMCEGRPYVSYYEATRILDRIRGLDKKDNKEAELKELLAAIKDTISAPDFVGDVLFLYWCSHVHRLLNDNRMREQDNALVNKMIAVVASMQISSDWPRLAKEFGGSKKKMDTLMTRLAERHANSQRTISSNTSFVTNAIWVRSYHCESLSDGIWLCLNRITSLQCISKHREVLSRFMQQAPLNTLLISTARSIEEVVDSFGKDDEVQVFGAKVFKDLKRLNSEYQWPKRGHAVDMSDTRELEVLYLISKLASAGGIVTKSTRSNICSIVKTIAERASYESTKSFYGLEALFKHAGVDGAIHDLLLEEIYISIRVCLQLSSPAPKDISFLVRSKLSYLLRQGKSNLEYLAKYAGGASRHKEYTERSTLELFDDICNFAVECGLAEELWSFVSKLRNEMVNCIRASEDKVCFATSAFKVAANRRDFLVVDGLPSACLSFARTIILETGIASEVRRDASMLNRIVVPADIGAGLCLISELAQNLEQEMKLLCTNIEDAVGWYQKMMSCVGPESDYPVTMSTGVILNSFEKWSPSKLTDLLALDGSVLGEVYQTLQQLPTQGSGDCRQLQGKDHASNLQSIVRKWVAKYSSKRTDLRGLNEASKRADDLRWATLSVILTKQFPAADDIRGTISLINSTIDAIRLSLTFGGKTIATIASHYRVSTGKADDFSRALEYFSEKLIDSLSLYQVEQDLQFTESLNAKHGSVLTAASHFIESESAIFKLHLGSTWVSISLDDFLHKANIAVDHMARLYADDANFADIQIAAVALEEEEIYDIERLRESTHLPCQSYTPDSLERLQQIMALASSLEQLRNFVNCCKILKFRFVEEADEFSELDAMLERLNVEGQGLSVGVSLQMCERIASILYQPTREFLQCMLSMKPVLSYFSVLLHCGSVVALVKERGWFGGNGLASFNKEFDIVTNTFNGQQFESELLDRLQPVVKAILAAGCGFETTSISFLVGQLLELNDDILKLNELRLVQTNILKIRDFFESGLDEVGAILSKFSHVRSSGLFSVTTSNNSCRELDLAWGLAEVGRAKMNRDEIETFVQHLGFMSHEDEASSKSASKFTDVYRRLAETVDNQQALLDVGFPLEVTALECPFDDVTLACHWLVESERQAALCNNWLDGVRSKYCFSLLFWMDELLCLGDIVTLFHHTPIHTQDFEDLTRKWMSMLTRVESSLAANQRCLEIISTVTETFSSSSCKTSWLEESSSLLHMCCVGAHLPWFQTTTKGQKKMLVLHKVQCDENSRMVAPLNILGHIFRNRCPKPFEVLDCTRRIPPDVIRLFLDRVLAFPGETFVISCVEQLSASGQEHIASFLAMHASSPDPMNLHLVQLRDTLLHSPPGIYSRAWNEKSMKDIDLGSWLTTRVICPERHITKISVVCGSRGSGKTMCIRSAMEKYRQQGCQVASIYIHEDFTLGQAIAQLNSRFDAHVEGRRVLHVSLNSDIEGELEHRVNLFFNSFCINQSVHDFESETCVYAATHSWVVLIEIGGISSESECRHWLSCHIPILAHGGSDIRLPPQEFAIDEQTRRVCTYLRAYDDGMIDDKFNARPSHKGLFFVIDNSYSMSAVLGDRTSLEVAVDSMLSIFDSHLQLGDSLGLVTFNSNPELLIQFQQISSEETRHELRAIMNEARRRLGGGTDMYAALSTVLANIPSNSSQDTWVICLTDGETSNQNLPALSRQLYDSRESLHVIVVGVNLRAKYADTMVQLCDKFHNPAQQENKGFFLPTSNDVAAIEGSFNTVAARIPVSQTFELHKGRMNDDECRAKLIEHMPCFVRENKLLSKFWVRFLYRRVSVFDSNEDFNYNQTYDRLGSSLMKVMLQESSKMLQKEQTWTSSNHTQLIYDYTDPTSPRFRLICSSPGDLSREEKGRFDELELPGFCVPTARELRQRERLDEYLSQALSIPLSADGRLQCIDDNKFVLTLDFTLKLLSIHERVACGVPCCMEGETGVSKTALTRMYSILVNSHHEAQAKSSTLNALIRIVNGLGLISSGQLDMRGSFELIRNHLQSPFHLNNAQRDEIHRSTQALLLTECSQRDAIFEPLPETLESRNVVDLLTWFVEGNLLPTFFDINIHGSLTAQDIQSKFDEVKVVARSLLESGVKVVVFLDEINTSCVLGLLKEIVVDRSIQGERLEDNIVIISACNPVRQNVSRTKPSRELDLGRDFISGHYNVKPLPLTLELVKWDYGSLASSQEKDFIYSRIKMLDQPISDHLARSMTEVIAGSHESIRELALDHLRARGAERGEEDNISRSKSVVSLRDIQRVFHLFGFFLSEEFPLLQSFPPSERIRRAVLLSVAIVYYLRLDEGARANFLRNFQCHPSEQNQDVHLLGVLKSAMDSISNQTEIPIGIALTEGLKENIFLTLVCTLSRTPLMIVGPPGCSKTLAVTTVCENANGEESPSQYFRQFPRIQPFHYQCSKTSNSTEISAVFDRAIQRQSNADRSKSTAMVFMDEAGLPEEEKESLKVLHYLLEGHMSAAPEIGFVCITNHILDAAKSNRCVCLLRPEADKEELMCIATGLIQQRHEGDTSIIELIAFEDDLMTQTSFCESLVSTYLTLTKNKNEFAWFVHFFGLRDFIHTVMHLRKHAAIKGTELQVTSRLLIEALERNFSGRGIDDTDNILAAFLAGLGASETLKSSLAKHRRHPLMVLADALEEVPTKESSRYNLPRYKMLIDSSNDDSIMRLLRAIGILDSTHCFYRLSGMLEGSDIETLNLISRVKFACQRGDTVVLSQVESIAECLYDVFNQHFTEFQKGDETVYYANMAIGGVSRPCPVHALFQCIVHVQFNQLESLPAPLLNRFETYELSVTDVLSWQLSHLSRGLNNLVSSSLDRCLSFIANVPSGSFWSPSPEDTVKSIFISSIPHVVDCTSRNSDQTNEAGSVCLELLHFLERNLRVQLTIEDVVQAADIAMEDLKHSVDGLEIEKVMSSSNIDRPKLVDAIGRVLDGILDSPLVRVLAIIAETAITKRVMTQVLQIFRPEAILIERNTIPKEMLVAYFHEQDHFSLKGTISKFVKGRSQLIVLHLRSDSCSHCVPSWTDKERNAMDSNQHALETIINLVHDDPTNIEVNHLDLLSANEALLRGEIDDWASASSKVGIYLLVVDVKREGSFDLVNFVRSYVESIEIDERKRFFLMLHYPLSTIQRQYPSLFLGRWDCALVDGVGVGTNSPLPFNNIFSAVCLNNQAINSEAILSAVLPKALQYVSSKVTFYTNSSHDKSVNTELSFTQRLIRLKELVEVEIGKDSLGSILIEKYANLWPQERLCELLEQSAQKILAGTASLNLSSACTSLFQHTFNQFLAFTIRDINAWCNLDCFLSKDEESDEIIGCMLRGLECVPLNELLLHKDPPPSLDPLPQQLTTVQVYFPFFKVICSSIEKAIDNSLRNMDSNEWQGYEAVVEMTSEMLRNETQIIGDVINMVEMSSNLFEQYERQLLVWKYGFADAGHGLNFIASKIEEAIYASNDICPQNLPLLHALCRMNSNSLVRMSTWGLNQNTSEGSNFVGQLIEHLDQRLRDNTSDVYSLSLSVSASMASIPSMLEGRKVLEDSSAIRRLNLFRCAIRNGHSHEAAASLVVKTSSEESLSCLVATLDNPADAGTRNDLLEVLFSPQWLGCTKVEKDVLDFVVNSIESSEVNKSFDRYLHNLFLSKRTEKDTERFLLPTKTFDPLVSQYVCKRLSFDGLSVFDRDQRRVSMPHYVPSWLDFDDRPDNNNSGDAQAGSDLAWYFHNYRNSCNESNLAESTFQNMLVFIDNSVRANGTNSERLLVSFLGLVEGERNVSNVDQVRWLRQAALGGQDEQSVPSFVGTPIGALELSALTITLLGKIAQELAVSSRAMALDGTYSDSAEDLLRHAMSINSLRLFFFNSIIRISGEGHLASLLSESGELGGFEWAAPFKLGQDELRAGIVTKLNDVQNEVRALEREITERRQIYRACPACTGLFAVDQVNCGQFYCGRDAHGIGGRPAIGGRVVNGVYGCGHSFSLQEALPYERSTQCTDDSTNLAQLRQVIDERVLAFNEHNEGAEHWRNARSLQVPVMAFHTDSVFPSIDLAECLSEESRTRISNIGLHLKWLEQLPYLPSMVELYSFLHSTFRAICSREECLNMPLASIMNANILKGRFGALETDHILSVWDAAVEGVNLMLQQSEGIVMVDCEEVTLPFNDLSDVSLMAVLSEGNSPEDGHDYLFLIIRDLVLRYNNFVESIMAFSGPSKRSNELYPKTLIRNTRSTLEVLGLVSTISGMLKNLAERFWSGDSFDVDSLRRALAVDARPIRNPTSFLREKFEFRESCVPGTLNGGGDDAIIYCSSDGLHFSNRQDWSLYNEVLRQINTARRPAHNRQDARHTMYVTFSNATRESLTTILEGMRNVLSELNEVYFNGQESFAQAVMSACGGPLQSVGFGNFNEAQSGLLGSMKYPTLVQVVSICGEMIASEMYRFSRLPSRLFEPLSLDERQSIRRSILKLARQNSQLVADITSFCTDVLDFCCDRIIVPESEKRNMALKTFLEMHNLCDESDEVFNCVPESVSLWQYVDLQSKLSQVKLEIMSKQDAAKTAQDTSIADLESSKKAWKWTKSPSQNSADAIETYHFKASQSLWFKDAIALDFKDTCHLVIDCEDEMEAKGQDSNSATIDSSDISDDPLKENIADAPLDPVDQPEPEDDVDPIDQLEDDVDSQEDSSVVEVAPFRDDNSDMVHREEEIDFSLKENVYGGDPFDPIPKPASAIHLNRSQIILLLAMIAMIVIAVSGLAMSFWSGPSAQIDYNGKEDPAADIDEMCGREEDDNIFTS